MTKSDNSTTSPFKPVTPTQKRPKINWNNCSGLASILTLMNAAKLKAVPYVLIVPDMQVAWQLENEINFFASGSEINIIHFPDWETLPYDVFSPLPEIISQRLEALFKLPAFQSGILIIPVSTLMQQLPPRQYLDAQSFIVDTGDTLNFEDIRIRLDIGGYNCVSQVMSHGEFAIRGSILDLYPMGHPLPFRIDLLDDEVDSIRTFNPENQKTIQKIDNIRLLPAREYPFTPDAIDRFRNAFRQSYPTSLSNNLIYREVSKGNTPGGLEYYLPLFFESTATLFDYLPDNTIFVHAGDTQKIAREFEAQYVERYEQRKYDQERPPLSPTTLFLSTDAFIKSINCFKQIFINSNANHPVFNLNSTELPDIAINSRKQNPFEALQHFTNHFKGKTLIVAESDGRREILRQQFRKNNLKLEITQHWAEFLQSDQSIAIVVADLEQGLLIPDTIAVLTENQLYDNRVTQRRRRKKNNRDADLIVKNLTELEVGAPVVHIQHGVGRYLGLQKLNTDGNDIEFLTIEYAKGDKLYVPVAALDLISRYTGAAPENAPLHKLGSEQWSRIKKKAAEHIRDVAAELLNIYARREAQKGLAFTIDHYEYNRFTDAFPFEETPDQQTAIMNTIKDLEKSKPMDRVICGDVGFGKTEVALRAAFIAIENNKQVAVLVPTTLLAQQHYNNFLDRFADWPVRIECLSRFKTQKQQNISIEAIKEGKIDIIIGTHKLLQKTVQYKYLGLVIIDEEHRFGVRHKEHFKTIRANVDLLTLTATPIPRTLNSSLAGLRDLSIIATPPAHRHPIKTFIHEWDQATIIEACNREIKRGGQVYFLHNEVKSIDRQAEDLQKIMPDIKIGIAHGQMRERDLEKIMQDFYHRRFHLLLCTTIIESGIDLPNANTIIIYRADKLGLAQLHQLRGRVGRSHHRAYAYLIVPPKKAITRDAVKRLEAIESMEDLGAGFTLATHDLEIRGAGELLGEEQSGEIHEIGFSLFSELLERAVKSLKEGKTLDLEQLEVSGTEVDLHIPALIPDDYIPDVHLRLVMYKRISSTTNQEEQDQIYAEMIDRFGLLPKPTKNLFALTTLKHKTVNMGIQKINSGKINGWIKFNDKPNIDMSKMIALIQSQPQIYQFVVPDKLKYNHNIEDPEQRINFIDHLLNKIMVSA